MIRELPIDHNGPCAVPECPVRARWEVVAPPLIHRYCQTHRDQYDAAVAELLDPTR